MPRLNGHAPAQTFFRQFRTDAVGTTFTHVQLNGGLNNQSKPGVEANLDIQYTEGEEAVDGLGSRAIDYVVQVSLHPRPTSTSAPEGARHSLRTVLRPRTRMSRTWTVRRSDIHVRRTKSGQG